MNLSQSMPHDMVSADNSLEIILLIVVLILIALVTFLIIILYKKEIFDKKKQETYSKFEVNEFYDESQDKNLFLEDKSNLKTKTNFEENQASGFRNKIPISMSIDEQEYQRKRIVTVLTKNPQGILQSRLPDITNLSKATISRRVAELYDEKVINREPRGRSILITLKA